MTDRPKGYSTRRPKPAPPEFEQVFVTKGWCAVNRMYGKRCSQRWFIALGPQRLRAARNAHLLAARQTAVTVPAGMVQEGPL